MARNVFVGDIEEAGRKILSAVRRASEHTARRTPGFINKLARRGLKPDGTPQPALAASTIKSKRRKGQPLTPGVATRHLTTVKNWTVRAQRGVGYDIYPPAESEEYLPYLEARGYLFVEFPDEAVDFLSRRISEEIAKVK